MGVYDGHGGAPTSDWLESNFSDFVDQHWDGPQRAVQSITEAFMQVWLAAVWLAAVTEDSAVHSATQATYAGAASPSAQC